MRPKALFGTMLIAALAVAGTAGAQRAERNSAPVAATAPRGADAARTYEQPMDALLAADLDYLVRDARQKFANGDRDGMSGLLVFLDEMAAGRWSRARTALTSMPEGLESSTAGLFEPFLLASEGRAARAIERVEHGDGSLPSPLPEIAQALILEGAGRLPEAAARYAEIERTLDVRPPPEGEPQTIEDVGRLLTANRTTNTLYRAALVNHQLRRNAEAARLYALVAQFAPRSADVEMNQARLARGEASLPEHARCPL